MLIYVCIHMVHIILFIQVRGQNVYLLSNYGYIIKQFNTHYNSHICEWMILHITKDVKSITKTIKLPSDSEKVKK